MRTAASKVKLTVETDRINWISIIDSTSLIVILTSYNILARVIVKLAAIKWQNAASLHEVIFIHLIVQKKWNKFVYFYNIYISTNLKPHRKQFLCSCFFLILGIFKCIEMRLTLRGIHKSKDTCCFDMIGILSMPKFKFLNKISFLFIY